MNNYESTNVTRQATRRLNKKLGNAGKRFPGTKNRSILRELDYADIPKEHPPIPERRRDETFEEYLMRVRTGR